MSETQTDVETGVSHKQDEPAIAYTDDEWEADAPVDDRDAVTVGATISFTKSVTDDDVHAFADASGDTNRLHLDDEFASETRFGGRIAHGALVSGWISAALARLPGVVVYLSQDLEFQRPAELGATLTATCEVIEDLGDYQYRLSTRVTTSDGTIVIDGEAIVLLDEVPATEDI